MIYIYTICVRFKNSLQPLRIRWYILDYGTYQLSTNTIPNIIYLTKMESSHLCYCNMFVYFNVSNITNLNFFRKIITFLIGRAFNTFCLSITTLFWVLYFMGVGVGFQSITIGLIVSFRSHTIVCASAIYNHEKSKDNLSRIFSFFNIKFKNFNCEWKVHILP